MMQLFTPILFKCRSAVEAGQMGMTMSVCGTLTSLAISWMYTKSAPFGKLVARREYKELDRSFFRALAQSVGVAALGAAVIWVVAAFLHHKGYRISQRLLPPVPLGMVLLATVCNIVVFGEAIYLRAHKTEKFMSNALLSAFYMAPVAFLVGRSMKPHGGAWALPPFTSSAPSSSASARAHGSSSNGGRPCMPDGIAEPLLTLAIPTYNRADRLQLLLETLLPQAAAYRAQLQIIVSDNASTDTTPTVIASAVASFAAEGIAVEVLRNPANLGPDGNFLGCLQAARGRFFWICGDDDIIVPGGLAEVMALLTGPGGAPAELDMVHVTSYGFTGDFLAERQHDPFGRTVHTVTDVHRFVHIVQVMFTFVSGTIVNRGRLAEIAYEDPANFLDSKLIQLAWVLPLLLNFRRAQILWTRPLAVRQGHANGYSLGEVFGTNLHSMLPRFVPSTPSVYATLSFPTHRGRLRCLCLFSGP